MRARLGVLVDAVLLLVFGAAPAFSVPMDCKPVRALWTPVGIYLDTGLGLEYRAESREYRCVFGGKKEVKIKENREVFLGLPKGVWLLRYSGNTMVLFVREGAGDEGRAFAESLLAKGAVDLLLIHRGVQLSPSAVQRARLVLRLEPGGHALSLAGGRFPLYRLETILDELDGGLGPPAR